MIHTAELITQITPKEYEHLRKRKSSKIGILFDLSQKGITRIEPMKIERDFTYYFCKIIINLNRIANNGERTTALFSESNESLKKLYENFNEFMGALLPYRANLNFWKVTRIDYTIDIHTPYCKEYIELLQRGRKPPRLSISGRKTHKASGGDEHYAGSVRFSCGSYTINIYDKEKERINQKAPQKIIEETKDILRVEIQCKSPKIDYISKKNGLPSKPTIETLTSLQDEQENMFKKAVKSIEGGGTYYTLKMAVKAVEESKKQAHIKYDMVLLLEFVSTCRNLQGARANYKDKNNYERALKHLRDIGVNPVTIPKRWGIESLPAIGELLK